MDSREHRKARDFFEKHFRPWKVSAGRYSKGLFTGYYEPSLNGSLERHGPYQTPVHARPADLVMVDLGMFREDLKGKRIAGRVNGGRLHPFEDRAEIVAGKLPKESSEVIAWVDDPVGAFFLQIQGSGRIALDNGEVLRVGYAGQNGYPYYAIGRELIKRGQLTKENVSLQSIRAWLEAHPHRAAEIMNTNKSYVFFRVLDGPGPLGAEGVPLTQGRSLAVDRTKFTYGVPVWIDTQPPVKGYWPLQQLMIAQDTGGAIRGAVRGDVFWGHGERAERLAGHMKSKGEMWILLPVSVNL
jgi:membrane-bound lytic murein transglycosylase A